MLFKSVSRNTVIRWSWIIWAISGILCLFFLAVLGYVMDGEELPFTKISTFWAFLFLSIFLLGCFSFLIGLVVSSWSDLPKNRFLKILLLPLVGLVYPLYLLLRIVRPRQVLKNFLELKFLAFKPSKAGLSRFLLALFVLFAIVPFWAVAYIGTWFTVQELLGFVEEPVSIVGTGSMYPTWPKGTSGKTPKELGDEVVASAGALPYPNGLFIFGRNFFGHEIGRGDIVTFENQRTREITKEVYGEESGFIKRVVAVAGDTIEFRDGIFYLNGEAQKEPYIARSRSTFGGEFIPDCRVLSVPEGMVFVMGDNRKGSGDSRHDVGFVAITDIDQVIPWESQKGELDKNWHDATNDLDESAKIRIDKDKYLELLNEERRRIGARTLKYQTKLEESAKLRGEVMLKFDDLSWEATRSGYTMSDALLDTGYSNITFGEAPALGVYEAQELIENQLEFAESRKFFDDKTFQEVGIAQVEMVLNGCPKTVTVVHMAGYVPPNYSEEMIDSWRVALTNLRNIQPGWESLKGYGSFYDDHKNEIDRINEIITIRISRISAIVAKMEANQWLSAEEEKWADEDGVLGNEQNVLAEKLNNY